MNAAFLWQKKAVRTTPTGKIFSISRALCAADKFISSTLIWSIYMDSKDSCTLQSLTTAAIKPTEYLCGVSDQRTLIMIHRLIVQGFVLKDVQAMISSSELYSNRQIIKRILGKSVRAAQRQKNHFGVPLLDSRLSTLGKALRRINLLRPSKAPSMSSEHKCWLKSGLVSHASIWTARRRLILLMNQ